MAEGKKSFILYTDIIDTFEHLTNEQRGEVIWWILQYVNDRNPEPLNGLLMAVISTIRSQLKRDLNKYKVKLEQSSESGRIGNLKRWNTDLYNDYVKGVYTLEEAETIAKDRKVSPPDKNTSPPDPTPSHPIAKIADSVNVNGTVSVTETVNDFVTETKEVDSAPSENPKANENFQAQLFLLQIGVEKQHAIDFLKNRKNKKLANTETAFRQIVAEINKTGHTPDEIIKMCAANGWGSFKNSWDWKETVHQSTQSKNKYQSADDLMEQIKQKYAGNSEI